MNAGSAISTQSRPGLRVWLVIAFLLLSSGCATTPPVCPPLPQISPTALEIASRPSPLRQLLDRIEAEKSTPPVPLPMQR